MRNVILDHQTYCSLLLPRWLNIKNIDGELRDGRLQMAFSRIGNRQFKIGNTAKPTIQVAHIAIKDFRMGRVSGMEISSSQGMKKTSKNQPKGRNSFLPRAVGPREARVSFPRANFKVFFNPRDEEISIPETQGPFGNCIPVGVDQAKFLFHMKFLLHFDKFQDACAMFYEILQKKLKNSSN